MIRPDTERQHNVSGWIVAMTIALLGSGLARAQQPDYPEPLQNAISALVASSSGQWSYVRETRDDDGHYVERYDPALPRDEQWQLLLLDGQKPTAKQIKRYRREYDELFERDDPLDVDLSGLIDPATVRLDSETEDALVYAFQPSADSEDDKKIVEQLLGHVTIDQNDNAVLLVEIESKHAFSPVAMVKIFSMSMSLKIDAMNDGMLHAVSVARSKTEGRFMGIKKFSENEQTEFRDFVAR